MITGKNDRGVSHILNLGVRRPFPRPCKSFVNRQCTVLFRDQWNLTSAIALAEGQEMHHENFGGGFRYRS